MGLAERIAAAYPGAEWTLIGDDLAWHGPGEGPSADDLAALRAAPEPGPAFISPRQWIEGLWHEGIISFAECVAFLETRAIPSALQAILVAALADDDTGQPTPRKLAISLVKGATRIEHANPLTDLVRAARGWSPAEFDARWRAWAAL